MGAKAQARLELTARDKTTAQLAALNTKLGALVGTANAAQAAFGALGMSLGPAVLLGVANRSIRAGSAITDMASATRTGVEELQSLTYAARIAGASNEQMANALIRVQKSAADARRGLSTATDAFAKLGLNVDDFIRLRPEQMLETLSRKLAQSGDDTESYAAAMDLLGTRNAPKLLEALLRLGNDGFATVSREAKKAGQVMREDVAVAMDDTADSIDELSTALTTFTASLLSLMQMPGKGLAESFFGGLNEIPKDIVRQATVDLKLNLKPVGRLSADELRSIEERARELMRELEVDTRSLVIRRERDQPPQPPKPVEPQHHKPVVVPFTYESSEQFDAFLSDIQQDFDPIQVDAFVNSVQAVSALRELTETAQEAGAAFSDTVIPGFEGVVKISETFANETVPEFTDSVQRELTEMEHMGRALGAAIEDSLAQALVNGELNVKSFVSMFLAEFAKLAIIRPLLNSILGGSPIGAFLGFIGGASGAPTGGNAGGGMVLPGSVVRVGEQGPENIIMGGPGYVQTTQQSAGTTVYLDARGADSGAVARIENALRQLNATVEVRAVGAVASQFARNPRFGGR